MLRRLLPRYPPGWLRACTPVQHLVDIVKLFLQFGLCCHSRFPCLSSGIGDLKPPVFGVFIDAHAVKLIGALGVADAVRENGCLLFFAFGLLAGDLLRHTGPVFGESGAVKCGRGELSDDGDEVLSAACRYHLNNATDTFSG